MTELQSSTSSGDHFTRTLAMEYRSFSKFEAEEMVDWPDAEHFARKGLLAARGIAVEPEELDHWRLPDKERHKLGQARSRLAWALSAGASHESPVSAATAQSRFDCWVEQQEENWQHAHIAMCRDGFYTLLSELESLDGPRAARIALVLFAFDSDEIDAQGSAILDALSGWILAANATSVTLQGHTDRAGTESYNIDLSIRRALAARSTLVRLGIRPEIIAFSGVGETLPRIHTVDGVREAQNRRVEIEITLPEVPVRVSPLRYIDFEAQIFASAR